MAPFTANDNRITYFAETDARNKRIKFGIKAEDRTRHIYVIGKTGMGKSTLLENMAAQDIQGGEGICFIDPHGKTADLLLEYVPKERVRDVIYIAPFDTDYPISFNVLESVDASKRHLVVSGLMSTFKKIWEDAWSARMEYILTNTLLALLEAPDTTLLGVNRMLSDKAYRNEIISHVTDPSVKSFWVNEFANYTERMAAEAVPAIQNKVGQFTANPLIRNMIGQARSSFDFRQAMDTRKIIIINLSKGRIGDENMKLLGGLLVTKIYLAAMSRADVPDRVIKMLPNFYLFVDEFQNFANASFADILSEARKYKLNLTIAHQYIEQMDEVVRPAVFGNVGTMIAFRVGATDAEVFEKEFAPVFTLEDLVNLGKYQMYLKLMIDGLSSAPFSARTLPPIPHPEVSYVQEIIAASREQFARPRTEVEKVIVDFHESATPPASGNGKRKAVVSAPPISPAKPAETHVVPASLIVPMKAPASSAKLEGAPARPAPKKPVQRPEVKPAPPLKGHSSLKDALLAAMNPAPASSSKSTDVSEAKVPDPTPAAAPAQTPAVAPVSASAQTSAPVSSPVPKPTSTPDSPMTSQPKPSGAPKPVSLDALAKSSRRDPKTQTKENIDSLKNALAAAMAKKGDGSSASAAPASMAPAPDRPPVRASALESATAQDAVLPTSAFSKPEPTPLEVTKKVKPIPKISQSPQPAASSDTKPAEVPEEVLKNVLGM